MNYHHLPGTFRSQQAAQTLSKIRPLFGKLGISRVAHITGLDYVGIAVSTCIRPLAKHLSVSQGKGFNQALSDISAIMEAIEAFHMEHPPEPVLSGSYQVLQAKHPVISPDCFEPGCFTGDWFGGVLDWAAAVELKRQEKVFLPRALTSLDSTQSHPEYAFLSVSTNGMAAGNCFDEALCHAMYEVIERDALFQWKNLSTDQRTSTQLNINTIGDKNTGLIKKIQSADLVLKVWEVTSSVGIPTYHCALYDKNITRGLNLFTGTGTHLSKTIALSRAITEAAQARLTVISGNRDDIFPSYYQAQQAHIYPETLHDNGEKVYQDVCQPEFNNSFPDNVKQISCAIYKYHRHIFVVDHTKDNINIPVVQVIVPSMRFDGRRM